MNGGETICACLTPPGRGAIATVAVRGPAAWNTIRALFQPALPEQPTPGRFRLGRFGEELADQVVLAVKRVAPMPSVEMHCHGGPAAVRLILDTLNRNGIETVAWPDFFCTTAETPLQALAAEQLAHAPTSRTAAILLDQFHGAFEQVIRRIDESIAQGSASTAVELLDELARHAPLGRHLVEPWRLAIVGPPNVGKSCLVNALAGYRRSIVAAQPGTTRDVVTIRIAIGGWPVEVCDTAGLRETAGELEAEGIERARAAAAAADLCLRVVDATASFDVRLESGNSINVLNKVDLPPVWDLKRLPGAIRVSALTEQGLEDLCEALEKRLVADPPPPGAALPFTPVLAELVEEARAVAHAQRLEKLHRLLKGICSQSF